MKSRSTIGDDRTSFEERWRERFESFGLWLDAGCGAGTYGRFLLGRGLQVVAMDYSAPTILMARERSEAVILWCVADVNQLPVRPGSFDGAICFGALRLYWLSILPARWQRFQWLLETAAGKALFRYVPPLGLLFSHAFVVCGRKQDHS